MYVANYLAQNYGTNQNVCKRLQRCVHLSNPVVTQVTTLLDSLEFVIVPFVNPDGYDVSGTPSQSRNTSIMSHTTPPHMSHHTTPNTPPPTPFTHVTPHHPQHMTTHTLHYNAVYLDQRQAVEKEQKTWDLM